MAGSVNKAIIVGNLGQDPDVRRTQDGRPIVNLWIATSESWRDKASGERKERTHWHRVVIFNEALAKVAEQYLKKGSKVWVEGAMQTRKWTDKEGIDRYSTEVVLQGFQCSMVLLGKREGGVPGASSPNDYGSGDEYDDFGSPGAPARGGLGDDPPAPQRGGDMDDEIPF